MLQSRPPLTDRFGRRHNYLRISVTDRCNFRCAYCMPQENMQWTPRQDILTFEEIERLANLFVLMGVDKVRLTGGEPTTRKDLTRLIQNLRNIRGLGPLLLTTNGAALERTAVQLRDAGITGLNISLDTLDRQRFREITRRDQLEQVMRGIKAAVKAQFESLKINVVVMSGINDHEMCDFISKFCDDPIEIRFIEFMPFLSNDWEKGKMVPYAQMRSRIEAAFTLRPIDSGPNAVAKEFEVVGARARIGFITSMTEHFCGGCNRIRLTADGHLKVCLFSKTGPSLRDAMRGGARDDELESMIREALDTKWAAHPPMTQLTQTNDRPMISIGG